MRGEYVEMGRKMDELFSKNDELALKLKESEMSSAVLYEVIDNFYKVNAAQNKNKKQVSSLPRKEEIELYIKNRFVLDKGKGGNNRLDHSIQLDKTLCNKSLNSQTLTCIKEDRVVHTEKKKSRKIKNNRRNLSAGKKVRNSKI